MSLSIFRNPFLRNPMEQYFRRFYNDAMQRFEGPFAMGPYWYDQPLSEQCNIGNTVRTVINDEDQYMVEVNVSQFSPEELSMNLRGSELVIEGRHSEREDEFGSIERHFIRKYHLPEDVCLEKIQSILSKDGVLTVNIPKRAVQCGRRIPIMPASQEVDEEKQQ